VASPSSAISLSGKLNEFSLPFCGRESMAGRFRPVPEPRRGESCLYGNVAARNRRANLKLRRGFAASRSGKSAYF
jgi:hypothetical protein